MTTDKQILSDAVSILLDIERSLVCMDEHVRAVNPEFQVRESELALRNVERLGNKIAAMHRRKAGRVSPEVA